MSISVCMATYNGEKYIIKQIQSILLQLEDSDELIIVDDCSTDNTVSLIKSLNDNRIGIYLNNVNKGHVYSFGKALSLSTKLYVFMADQDDLWPKNRVALMLKPLLESNKMLLTANSSFIDEQDEVLDYTIDGVKSSSSESHFRNTLDILYGKMNYYGCVMVLRRNFKDIILPIPNFVESHDLWIAQAANLLKSNAHLDDVTLYRRVHGNNASLISRNIFKKIYSRIIFLLSIIVLYKRIIYFLISNQRNNAKTI